MPFNDPLIKFLAQPRRVWWTDKPPWAYTEDWVENIGKLNLLYVLYGLEMPAYPKGVMKHPLWYAVEEISKIKITYRPARARAAQILTMDLAFEAETPNLPMQVVHNDFAPSLYRFAPKSVWVSNLNKVADVQSRRR